VKQVRLKPDTSYTMPTVSVDWLVEHSLKAAVIVIGAAIIVRAARAVIASGSGAPVRSAASCRGW
jgi:hypothetical protein